MSTAEGGNERMETARHNPQSGGDASAGHLVARPFSRSRDLNALLNLYARAFEKEVDERQWSWKYAPPWASRSFSWVAEADGRLVGHIGVLPFRGQLDRKEVTFFMLGDALVDPEYRSVDVYAVLRPGQLLTKVAEHDAHGIVFGFSADKIGAWYRWISDETSAITVEAAHDRLVRRRLATREDSDIELQPWGWDAPEIEKVWARQRAFTRIGLIRDRTYLAWRYGAHPTYSYSLFGVLYHGEPVGWIVITAVDRDTAPPVDDLRIHDLLLPPPLRVPALQQAAAFLNVDSVVVWLPENAIASGMESRPNGWDAMHLSLSSAFTKEQLARSIYYTLGEADQWWW
jgi:hypothetical protein